MTDTDNTNAAESEESSDIVSTDEALKPSEDKPEDTPTDNPEGKPEGESKPLEISDLDFSIYDEINDKSQEAFLKLTNELDLTKEQAQEIMKFDASREDNFREQLNNQIDEWEKEIQNDKELSADIEQTKASAKKALDQFAPDGLTDLLDSTGLGSHPLMVKLFKAVGEALSEDKLVTGRESTEPKGIAETLYNTA